MASPQSEDSPTDPVKDQLRKDQELNRHRFQLEDADRKAYYKSSAIKYHHYEEIRNQLTKENKNLVEQLKNKRVSFPLL